MGFRQKDSEGRGGFARIWSIEDKGNYSIAKISTSKKNDGGYETDFQDGFVRFIGAAHDKAKELKITEKGVLIQITSCEVTTPYNSETKKGYVNYAVFSFDIPDSGNKKNTVTAKKDTKSTAKPTSKKPKNEVDEDECEDDDLPF